MTVASFDLTVPGPVRGQGRPRFNRATGHAHTDAKTRSYAGRIHDEWIAAGRPALPARTNYSVSIFVGVERPAGHYKKDGALSAEGRRRPFPGKPDLDNCVKWLDALVAVGAVPDDLYAVRIIADKAWGVNTLRFYVKAVA